MSLSSKEPVSEALKLLHGEDSEALDLASFGALWRWMQKIEPFCAVRYQHLSFYAERIGVDMTAHVDAAARRQLEKRAEANKRASSARFSARVDEYLDGKPYDNTLESTLAKLIEEAGGKEAKARSRLRRRAHARLTGGAS